MRPRLDHILAVVAIQCQVPVAHITGDGRWRSYIEARETFIHAARAYRYKLNDICAAVKRNKSSVQSHLRKDPAKIRQLNAVLSRLMAREAA